ncbi:MULTISPECIES: SOS response-associated peptidase family protein [unclassified Burkholderia]|uniref:SOS response-associated peptidase family protein n=1 Tax=unclassified Burkholderia TaxID=2613784 RepID=UPI00141EA31E|nr:hypothetical protein [Burkholderia sp. Ap-955]NIF09562.1 hypothetical protein [Burkholderia sp. Ax-1735]NIG01513.1 hypothetical protein [Burkholderia sp. Tr-849]
MNELKIGIRDLYRRAPWEPDVYPDYAAPIASADGEGLGVVKAVFGFWPKFMQPERVDDNGKKRRKLDTVNARSETVGESRLYGKAWRAGQRCLIPVRWIYEPCVWAETKDYKPQSVRCGGAGFTAPRGPKEGGCRQSPMLNTYGAKMSFHARSLD